MQQERHVIPLDLQVALVNVRRKRQRIQLFCMQLRPHRVMNDLPVFAVAGAGNLFQRLPVSVFGHGVIKLTAHHKIDVLAGHQRFVRPNVSMRADERNLHPRVCLLNLPDQFDIAVESNRGRI